MTLAATLTAPAKINLFLRILGRRADGYHDLDTLFLPLAEPRDVLEITPGAPGSGLALACAAPGLEGPDNLVAKAWRRYAEATGFAPALAVRLTKGIPTGAGLGGGSSDAAAILLFLNAKAGKAALPAERLSALAATLGADVPFFLLGRPARATGIGDRLTPVEPDLGGLTLVLVCPDAHVPTAWAYARFDEVAAKGRVPRAPGFLTSGARGTKNPSSLLPLTLFNDFEDAVFPAFPELRRIKERLIAAGAAAAAMSGSGASVFALFRERERALETARSLARGQDRTYVQDFDWGVAKR
ncbi:4-(cytidine 5'-diphospho)-2-C-methyl-D-erythritol kinase [Desulfovibrio aminophilus]|nr:4-(cytidine 5'-diphospho)-2-C-methyl-D-erythritol kinase [Desulfovibrio aminophilus]MCM0755505.1 4-(cytidine 5'-diphospho)-2-C-methyl-D-erythritol kinase [Desulfovibrio aminophilus]